MSSNAIPAMVIGASGYVGGELLRLIAAHPHFELAAAISGSRAGEPIAGTFRHLASATGTTTFQSLDRWLDGSSGESPLAVFSAAPHGASAAVLDKLLDAFGERETHVVDASADFRFADRDQYEAIYGPHGASHRLAEFSSGLPEHVAGTPTRHIGNPGCFATSMLLAIVPLLELKLTEPVFRASGITGSTGSGRTPGDGTHHPERHSNLYAYKALAHRHAPEVVAIAKSVTTLDAELHFVPHSGPFARGIHMSVFAPLSEAVPASGIREALRGFYANSAFVSVSDSSPKLKNVVASNYAELGVAASGGELVVTVTIDNLVKGAAGGAMQWMNRLFDLDDTCGLTGPAPAWT